MFLSRGENADSKDELSHLYIFSNQICEALRFPHSFRISVFTLLAVLTLPAGRRCVDLYNSNAANHFSSDTLVSMLHMLLVREEWDACFALASQFPYVEYHIVSVFVKKGIASVMRMRHAGFPMAIWLKLIEESQELTRSDSISFRKQLAEFICEWSVELGLFHYVLSAPLDRCEREIIKEFVRSRAAREVSNSSTPHPFLDILTAFL